MDIEFRDLTYAVPLGREGSKLILRSISGQFHAGQLVAILGPSGAGKSSLLNILTGSQTDNVSGDLLVGGKSVNMHRFRKLSRYIPQCDLVQPHLTVLESMTFAATLKLGAASRPELLDVVRETLRVLRIAGVATTRTEHLSGGERRRLSVALELIGNPPVLFLDEPTTGLDDLSSLQCVSVLREIAQAGRTVICSIHTPSARMFAMFDHVYVLARGRCAFQGPSGALVGHLAGLGLDCPPHYNPADYVIDVCSGDYGEHLDRMVAAVENGGATAACVTAEYKTMPATVASRPEYQQCSSWLQYRVLVARMFLQSCRDVEQQTVKLIVHIVLGLLLGTTFFQFGNDGSKTLYNFLFCYTCVIFFMFTPMHPILLHFPTEVKRMEREYFNHWYRLQPYFWALQTTRLPFQVVFGSVLVTLAYFLSGQPLEPFRIFQFYGICLLLSAVSEAVGHVIGSTMGIVNGMFLGPVISVPLMLLAVYSIGYRGLTIPPLARVAVYSTYLRYGMSGLMSTIYGQGRGPVPCPTEEEYCWYHYPRMLLEEIGMQDADVGRDVAALVAFYALFQCICFVLLRWRLSSYRTFAALDGLIGFVKARFKRMSC